MPCASSHNDWATERLVFRLLLSTVWVSGLHVLPTLSIYFTVHVTPHNSSSSTINNNKNIEWIDDSRQPPALYDLDRSISFEKEKKITTKQQRKKRGDLVGRYSNGPAGVGEKVAGQLLVARKTPSPSRVLLLVLIIRLSSSLFLENIKSVSTYSTRGVAMYTLHAAST